MSDVSTPLSWKQIVGFALVGALIPAACYVTMLGFAFFTSGGPDVFLAFAPILMPALVFLYAIAISSYSGFFVSIFAMGLTKLSSSWAVFGFFVCLVSTLLASIASSNDFLGLLVTPYVATTIAALLVARRKRARGVPPNTA